MVQLSAVGPSPLSMEACWEWVWEWPETHVQPTLCQRSLHERVSITGRAHPSLLALGSELQPDVSIPPVPSSTVKHCLIKSIVMSLQELQIALDQKQSQVYEMLKALRSYSSMQRSVCKISLEVASTPDDHIIIQVISR